MIEYKTYMEWDRASDVEITERNIEHVKILKGSDAEKAKLIAGFRENFRRREAERVRKVLSGE